MGGEGVCAGVRLCASLPVAIHSIRKATRSGAVVVGSAEGEKCKNNSSDICQPSIVEDFCSDSYGLETQ